MRSWPNMAERPLSECAARKMALSRSGSGSRPRWSSSTATSRASVSRISLASAMNSVNGARGGDHAPSELQVARLQRGE